MRLVPNEPRYYSYIHHLRTHPENIKGFYEQGTIPIDNHMAYMQSYGSCYFICLHEETTPVGYCAVVDDDVKICTDPYFKQKGVGTFMLGQLTHMFPNAKAKVLKTNEASLALFNKCGWTKVGETEMWYLWERI